MARMIATSHGGMTVRFLIPIPNCRARLFLSNANDGEKCINNAKINMNSAMAKIRGFERDVDIMYWMIMMYVNNLYYKD